MRGQAPRREAAPDPYDVLGVDPSADAAEVRAAYHRLAQIFHPDRFDDGPADVRAEAERRMTVVNAAYRVLRSRVPGLREDDPEIARAEAEAALETFRDVERRRREEMGRRARYRRWQHVEHAARRRFARADHPANGSAVPDPAPRAEVRERASSEPTIVRRLPGDAEPAEDGLDALRAIETLRATVDSPANGH